MRWYARAARDLPWRRTRDPYAIWVSEVMLQQTQVAKVIPYFTQFLKRFPTRTALARASLRDVLRVWEGMGYYARARNLHRAAREMEAAQPKALAEQRRGLAARAWRRAATAPARLPPSRLARPCRCWMATRAACSRGSMTTPGDARSARGEAHLLGIAARMMPARNPGAFNQALMELGATLCTPRAPQCTRCPLRDACRANARGTQMFAPGREPRARVPHVDVACGIVRRADRVLIAQRPAKALLGGLWEFPGGKRERGETLAACLRRELREELGIRVRVGSRARHARACLQSLSRDAARVRVRAC